MLTVCSACSARETPPTTWEDLRAAAERTDSSALVVMQGDKLLGEWYFDGPARPLELQSITKSVTALAMGALVGTSALPSLDEPVHHYFPEWKQGKKQRVTVRHLMTHTACLQDLPSTEHEVSPAPDAVQLALSAELVCEPGSQYAYSNKAVNLLAGIIHRASGEPLDALAKRVLFAPLGIQDFFWSKDRAGNPYVTGGLWLTPRDLVKIGQLVAQRGQWKGQQLLPHAWFDSLATTRPPQPEFYGLLWWGPQGSALRGSEQAQDVLIANGWRGQWLWVNMQTKLVAARVYDLARGTDRPEVSFDDFGRLMTGLQAVPAD